MYFCTLVLLTCCTSAAFAKIDNTPDLDSINPWQAHLEYIGVDTDLNWRSSTSKNSTLCLGVCKCTGDYADCSKRGLLQPPDVTGSSTAELQVIRTLDLSGNSIGDITEDSLVKFTNLQDLILKNNKLKNIPSFPKIGPTLKNLQLGGNEISLLSSDLLAPFTTLNNLGMERNLIQNLKNYTFTNNRELAILNLGFNQISEIESNAFNHLNKLQILEINQNELEELPLALSYLPNLERVTLSKNKIENILAGVLQNSRKLEQVELSGNPIHTYDKNAFVNLPNLKKLQILSSPRFSHSFPNLTGTPNLELIHLDRAGIKDLPENLCLLASKVKTLRLRSNSLSTLPNLTECSQLKQLDLGSNNLSSLGTKPFKTMLNLQDLMLDNNQLTNLTSDVFIGLKNLHVLNLESNNISFIHEETFMPLNNIKDLNLAMNSFAVLPDQGLKTLLEIKTHNNPNLKEFPGAQMFPNIRVVRPSYAYHCCQFIPSTYNQYTPDYADFTDLSEKVYFPEEFQNSGFGNGSINWSGNLSSEPGQELNLDLWENFVSGMGYPDISNYDENSISMFKPEEGIDCYPAPGPFLPCNDLFDWWSLRCSVWIVFLLALLGNGCVVFVLVLSRSKMDVPRFLVANLAAADFCMGLYLGMLAVLDASTLGEFRKYAIQWQLSAACEIAGFFGVLSSELSVFTLAVITLERNYAITHAMHLNKRLSLRHAAYIMIGAWSFSIFLASLPLIGVSDYRKFAICLPFETEGALSTSYVIFLMLINGVAFSTLMGCYLKMYCAIRGSQAWNSNDSRIAKRMALLVFTDFLCWFPIAFLSITAACGLQLVSLEGAKVFTVFILPLNSCCNPFLYAILTKQFKKDCVMICKAIEESRVTRGIGRCRHSSNFSNRQTPANTNSVNSGSGSGVSHSKNSMHCSCSQKKASKFAGIWPINKLKFLFGFKGEKELNSQTDWSCQIAEIQNKQQKTKRHASVSSDNFSSSRSDSYKQGHCIPLRFLDRPRRRNSWTVTRKPSQDSNMSNSRNDSAGSNSTQSTNTLLSRLSRSSVSSDMSNSLVRNGSGYSEHSDAGTKFGALARGSSLYRQNTANIKVVGGRGVVVRGGHGGRGQGQVGRGGGYPSSILARGKPRLIRQVAIQDEMPSGSSIKSVSFQDGRNSADACPVHQEQYSRYRTLYSKLTENSEEEAEEEVHGVGGNGNDPAAPASDDGEVDERSHLITTHPQQHSQQSNPAVKNTGISNPLSNLPDDISSANLTPIQAAINRNNAISSFISTNSDKNVIKNDVTSNLNDTSVPNSNVIHDDNEEPNSMASSKANTMAFNIVNTMGCSKDNTAASSSSSNVGIVPSISIKQPDSTLCELIPHNQQTNSPLEPNKKDSSLENMSSPLPSLQPTSYSQPHSPSSPPLPLSPSVKGLTMREGGVKDKSRRISLGQGGTNTSHGPQGLRARGAATHLTASLTNLLQEPNYGPQKSTSENALLALQKKYGYSFKSAMEGAGINNSETNIAPNKNTTDNSNLATKSKPVSHQSEHCNISQTNQTETATSLLPLDINQSHANPSSSHHSLVGESSALVEQPVLSLEGLSETNNASQERTDQLTAVNVIDSEKEKLLQ